MNLSYNKLWKLLIDKGLNKGELCKITGINKSTINKLNNGKNIKYIKIYGGLVWVLNLLIYLLA